MIGQTIWVYTPNNRVYVDDDGNKSNGPNFRHMWVPYKVVDETSRSWLLENSQHKVPKKSKWPQTWMYCYSEEEVEDRVWKELNQYSIARAVERHSTDTETLKKIAELIGYNK